MRDVTIRPAVMADLSAVMNLLEEGDTLHREALPWLFQQADRGPSVSFLERYVSKPDHVMLLATTADGSLAGVLYMFLRQPSRSPLVRSALVAEIDALVVASPFRRQRIGKRLVEAAFRWASDARAARIELGVFEFNESARAFWASVGFKTLLSRMVLRSEPEA
jgi:GNAT superfamily N-acetyltransferase